MSGTDFSGLVVRAGKNCKRLKEGDEVFGLGLFAECMAEYCVLGEDQAVTKPCYMSHVFLNFKIIFK